jgi:hypothetical protein
LSTSDDRALPASAYRIRKCAPRKPIADGGKDAPRAALEIRGTRWLARRLK